MKMFYKGDDLKKNKKNKGSQSQLILWLPTKTGQSDHCITPLVKLINELVNLGQSINNYQGIYYQQQKCKYI